MRALTEGMAWHVTYDLAHGRDGFEARRARPPLDFGCRSIHSRRRRARAAQKTSTGRSRPGTAAAAERDGRTHSHVSTQGPLFEGPFWPVRRKRGIRRRGIQAQAARARAMLSGMARTVARQKKFGAARRQTLLTHRDALAAVASLSDRRQASTCGDHQAARVSGKL